MKQGRKIKVPPEDRRITSIAPSAVVSQLKFATVSDNLNNFDDDFQYSFGIAVDLTLDLSDSFSLSDSLSLSIGISADVADAFLFLDSFTIDRGIGVGLSDTFTLTDSVSLGQGMSVADALTQTDAIELSLQYLSELSDLMSLTDGLEVGFGLATEDQFTLTDYLEIGPSQSVSDSFSLSDALTLTIGYPLEAADALGLSDGLGIGFGLSTSDQIALADSIATFGQIFLTIEDSIYNWDEFFIAIPQGVDFAIQRSDSFSLDDSITLFSAGFKSFAEALTLSDAYAQRGDGLIAFSDQFTLTDSVTKTIDCRLSFAESINNLSDNVALLGDGLIVKAESINNLADGYVQRTNGLKTFTEQLTQTDAFSMIEGEREILSDSSIQPSDSTARSGSIWDIGVTGEQLTQSDAIALNLDSVLRQVVVSDSFTLTDNCTTQRGPSRWRDAIVVQTSVSSALTQNLSDSLPAMADAFVQKKPRWRDAISVVKANASGLALSLSDTNSSMTDAVSTERVQIGTPISDISVGLWSSTPLFQKIDEFTASDADLIVSATNPASDTCEVGLTTTTTDPVSSSNHIVSYRYKKTASGGRQIDLTVRLMQGTTIIATFTHTNISNVIAQADQTLSGAQADAITNYGDLRIRFIGTAVGTGTGRAAQITWGQFRCPK
jgi:hypothetical protein